MTMRIGSITAGTKVRIENSDAPEVKWKIVEVSEFMDGLVKLESSDGHAIWRSSQWLAKEAKVVR